MSCASDLFQFEHGPFLSKGEKNPLQALMILELTILTIFDAALGALYNCK